MFNHRYLKNYYSYQNKNNIFETGVEKLHEICENCIMLYIIFENRMRNGEEIAIFINE
jgi:hypothetical protein